MNRAVSEQTRTLILQLHTDNGWDADRIHTHLTARGEQVSRDAVEVAIVTRHYRHK